MMRTRSVVSLSLIVCLLATLLLAGCFGGLYTLEKGRLRVATSAGFEPFTFKQDGRIVGFDIDLAREIARRLDLELEIVPVSWDWLIAGLFCESYDIFMSAMTITRKREAEINFIGPYFLTDQVIVVRKDSPIANTADLAGKTVGVLQASTALESARKIPGVGTVRQYDNYEKNYEALRSGKTDALIGDGPTCAYFSNLTGDTRLAEVIEVDDGYGIGILREKSALGKDIRDQLTRMIVDGTYREIYLRWFGINPAEVPR